MANYESTVKLGQKGNNILASPIETRVKVGTKIEGNRSKTVVSRPEQAFITAINRSFITNPLNPPMPTNLFNGTNIYTLTIQANSIPDKTRSGHLNLQFQNTSGSSSITMAPSFYGVTRWDWQDTENQVMLSLFGPSMLIGYGLYYDKWEFEQMSSNLGLTSSFSPNVSLLTIPPNGYLYQKIPINPYFDVVRPHWEKINTNLTAKLYTQNLQSSGSGTLSLVNASLSFDVDQDSEMYRKEIDQLYDNNIVRTNYLDCFPISQTVNLTAGQKTNLSLLNNNFKTAFLCFTIRSSTTCTNNGCANFVSLGNAQTDSQQAVVYLTNPQGNDTLNMGQGLLLQDLNLLSALYTKNELFTQQNIYLINFSTNLQGALSGSQNYGYYQFDGTNYNLVLQPSGSFPTGSYVVDIWIFYFRCSEISNSKISVCSY